MMLLFKAMLSTVDLQFKGHSDCISTHPRVNKHDPKVMFQILMLLSFEHLTTTIGFLGSKIFFDSQPMSPHGALEIS